MLAASSPTAASVGVNDAPRDLPSGDEQHLDRLLNRLVKVWGTYQADGLKRRHRMGSLLNQRLGPPDKRQPLRKRVLELASGRLGISVSELSRMRWLAHLFASVGDLREKHPKVNTFTEFKELLPDLMPSRGRGEGSRGVKKQDRALRGAVNSLGRVVLNLRRVGTFPSCKDRDDLLEKVRELNEVVTNGHGFNDPIAWSESVVLSEGESR